MGLRFRFNFVKIQSKKAREPASASVLVLAGTDLILSTVAGMGQCFMICAGNSTDNTGVFF